MIESSTLLLNTVLPYQPMRQPQKLFPAWLGNAFVVAIFKVFTNLRRL